MPPVQISDCSLNSIIPEEDDVPQATSQEQSGPLPQPFRLHSSAQHRAEAAKPDFPVAAQGWLEQEALLLARTLRLPFSSPSPDSLPGLCLLHLCQLSQCATTSSSTCLPSPLGRFPQHHKVWASANPSRIQSSPSPDGEQWPSHRADSGEGSKSGSD